jgi:hypothetical protein
LKSEHLSFNRALAGWNLNNRESVRVQILIRGVLPAGFLCWDGITRRSRTTSQLISSHALENGSHRPYTLLARRVHFNTRLPESICCVPAATPWANSTRNPLHADLGNLYSLESSHCADVLDGWLLGCAYWQETQWVDRLPPSHQVISHPGKLEFSRLDL